MKMVVQERFTVDTGRHSVVNRNGRTMDDGEIRIRARIRAFAVRRIWSHDSDSGQLSA